MKYAWIQQHPDSFHVKAMCNALQVNMSGFYQWLCAEPSPRDQRTTRIHQEVKQFYDESNQIYGSCKIAVQMQKDDKLETACRNTVAQAMPEMGLKSRVSKKFTPITTVTDSTKKPAPNLLDQNFTAEAPGQKWVTDITYVATLDGWVYLAVVLDLFSRKVVGWSTSKSLATPLVSDALRKAIENRRLNTNELLHHSDRGCQYTSEEYQRTLRTMVITCSMSRAGCCYDNAVMERFFGSLKHEWTKFETYADITEARVSVFQCIDTFYNTKRFHQTLEYRTPDKFEAEYQEQLAV